MEALRIADFNTIKLMFKESDERKIAISLERYKRSVPPVQGRILCSELGWHQFGRVPDVALIRNFPDKTLKQALLLWCLLTDPTEDVYEEYKRRVLYIHGKPVTICNTFDFHGDYAFLYGVPQYKNFLFNNRIFSLKYRQAVGVEEDLGGILALSDSDARDLSKWKRGRTKAEREVEFTLAQKLLFGYICHETEVNCLVDLSQQQLRVLRGLLDSDATMQRIKQAFYDQSYTKESAVSDAKWETYPKWHFDIVIPHSILFYKRLSENSNIDLKYTNENEYRYGLAYCAELGVDVQALRKTWENYPAPAKRYLNLLLKKETLGPALTWAPYKDSLHQLCACYIAFYLLSPSRIKQTLTIAQLTTPNEDLSLILRWCLDQTQENISAIAKRFAFIKEYDPMGIETAYSIYCPRFLPVVNHLTLARQRDHSPRLCEELRLVKGRGDKYGLLFCDQALSPDVEGKSKKYFVMSNVDPSDTLETILVRKIECLPKEYIGTENAKLKFRRIICNELPPADEP